MSGRKVRAEERRVMFFHDGLPLLSDNADSS